MVRYQPQNSEIVVALLMYICWFNVVLVSWVSVDSLHCLVCANRTQLLLTYAMHSFAPRPQLRPSASPIKRIIKKVPRETFAHFRRTSGRIFKPVRVCNGAKAFYEFSRFCLNSKSIQEIELQPEIFKWECSARDKIASSQWQIMAFLPISASRLATSNTLFEFENHKVENM